MPENAHATMSQADGVPMHCQDTHIRMRLDAAHDAGRKFRQRVQLPLICTGFVIVIVSLVAGTVSYAIIDSWTFHVGYVGLPAGLAMYLLALTPADDVLIRWTLYIFAGLLLVYAVIINVTTMDDYRALPVAGARRCSHALHGRVPCWWACTSVAISLFEALVCGMFAAQLLRYAVRAFSARARLEVLWKSGGQSAVTFGSCEAVRLVISASAGLMYMFAADSGVEFLGVDESTSSRSAMADGANPADVKLYFRIWIALIVSELFFGVLLLHGTYRSRVQAWLASRGEAVATAAGLASLLGNRPAPEVQALARSLFRYITLDALHFDDLADGKPNPRLYKLSQPAHFGTVDVFVSHSWSDNARSKWDALQAWRKAFITQHQREPRCWIDKCCIDQEHIEDNLVCLPVFLAGCNKLLALCGASYLHRLWCVIELSVFLEMGGTSKAIELSLLTCITHEVGGGNASVTQEQWLEYFGQFDARNATCLLRADQERLLMTIEAGFGGFAQFNSQLRAVLSSLVGQRFEAAAAAQVARAAAPRGKGVLRISGEAAGAGTDEALAPPGLADPTARARSATMPTSSRSSARNSFSTDAVGTVPLAMVPTLQA